MPTNNDNYKNKPIQFILISNADFEALTSVGGDGIQAGAIYFIHDKKKINVNGVEYGFNENDVSGKVDKTTKVAGHALTADITALQIKTAIGEATQAASGILSAKDKKTIDTLAAMLVDDNTEIVDTLTEILEVFNSYPEGVEIFEVLEGKVSLTGNETISGVKTFTDNVILSGVDKFLGLNLIMDNKLAINSIAMSNSDSKMGFYSDQGFIFQGSNVDLGSNKITSLKDPTANQDAATKFYVDSQIPNWIGENKPTYDASEITETTTHKIMTAAERTKLDGIASGAQVNAPLANKTEAEAGTDNAKTMTPLRTKEAILKFAPAPDLSPYLKHDGSIPMTGNLELGGNSIYGINTIFSETGENIISFDDLNLSIIFGIDATEIFEISTSGLDLKGYTSIINMANPTNNQDAATKFYVDSQVPVWQVV